MPSSTAMAPRATEFRAHATELDPAGRVVRFRVRSPEGPVSRASGYGLLRASGDFRRTLAEACASVAMGAYFFELPAVAGAPSRAASGQGAGPVGPDGLPFEWILAASPALEGLPADPAPFAAHLRPGAAVVRFDNLGGDARLVAPCAGAGDALGTYAHLAAFLRGAPPEQVDALWAAVGEELAARRARSEAPFWVSTSGLGVAWLHVRIDERPKYITHAPYRADP